MKAIIPITALLFLFISCESPNEPTVINQIIGRWQLKIVSGGFGGMTDTLSPNIRNLIYVFNEQNQINIFANRKNTFSGKYRLLQNQQNSNWEMKFHKYNKTDNDYPRFFDVFELSEKRLFFAEQGFDTFRYELERIKN